MTINRFLKFRVPARFILFALCFLSVNLNAEISIHQADWHGSKIKINDGSPNSLFGLDWKSLIPEKYAAITPGPIPEQFLTDFSEKKDRYSNVKFSFTRLPPKTFPKYHYYLVSKNGVHEIAIKNLESTVRFSLSNEDHSIISYVSYWGSLVSAENENSATGFVLISPNELSFKTAKISLKKGTKIEDKILSDKIEIVSPEKQIAHSFRVFIEQTKGQFDFILLNYDGKAFCYERMYLIANKTYPNVTMANYHGCDR